MNITRTETFDLAFRFVTETDLNVFLTGKAGTGKTTFLKYLRQNSYKKMIVAAPTGVAAINAGGVTLHSLFQLPFAPFIPSTGDTLKPHPILSQTRYHQEKLNLLRSLELLVIDEASMVACHTVDAMDTLLKSVRRRHDLPFGGVQVLFIGDLHQLQPVVKQEEWQLLKEYYSSAFFFDSLALKQNPPVMIELKEIFRQKDSRFIDLLNEIRNNTLTEENLTLLNSRLFQHKPYHDEALRPASSAEEAAITLTTHNRQADAINEKKLAALKNPPFRFKAAISGDYPEHLYPAEIELILKKGAQVMFIKNDTEEKKYFNGKTGVVTALSENLIKIKCSGENEEITVKRQEWQNVSYSLNAETKEVVENILGTFEQYPLRLAWAITIHKSQGLTFEKVIIDAENAFANGQVYVALSRCTSLEGLTLTTPVNRQFLGAHQNLREWQKKNDAGEDISKKFIDSRQRFALRELQNIFTWQRWQQEWKELSAVLWERKEELPTEVFIWMKELDTQQKQLGIVAEKFKQRILQMNIQEVPVDENTPLQQRVMDAAHYFHAELLKWKERFYGHPVKAGTKKIANPIDYSLHEVSFILWEMLLAMHFCKTGFSLSGYLEHQKKSHALPEKVHSSYHKREKNNGKMPPTVEESVLLFRQAKNVSLVAAERNLTIGTIEGHLARAIKAGEIGIEEIMPLEEVRLLSSYFPSPLAEVVLLVEIKEKLPQEVSYGKLKMVLAWLQKEKIK